MFARIVVESLRGRPGSTLWTLAALSMVSLLATAFATIELEAGAAMGEALRATGANALARPGASAPEWDRAMALARGDGCEVVKLDLIAGTIRGAPVGLVAADPAALAPLTPYWKVDGRRPAGPGEALAGRTVAGRLELAPGRDAPFRPGGEVGSVTLRIVGVLSSGDEDDERLFVSSLPDARSGPHLPAGHPALPGLEARAPIDCRSCHTPGSGPYRLAVRDLEAPLAATGSYLLLRARDAEGIDRLATRFEAAGVGLDVRPLRRFAGGEEEILRAIELLVGCTLAVVLGLVAVAVTASALARTAARRKELAIFLALGARRRVIARLLLVEDAVVGVAGSLLGFGLGSAAAAAILDRVFGLPASPRLAALVAAAACTAFVSLGSAAVALRLALRLRPAPLLRGPA